jgi:hypothetical protein
MKVTRLYAGTYTIQAKDGATFKAVVKEDSKEWRLYDDSEQWIDTFPTLKACKEWIGD